MTHEEEFQSNAEKKSSINMSKNTKNILSDYLHPRSDENTVKMATKMVEVDIDDQILSHLNKEAIDQYWSKLAEEKRLELEDALIENARLYKIKHTLIKQNNYYKEMLEEANSFITVFKEVVEDPANDTGIGLTELDDSNED